MAHIPQPDDHARPNRDRPSEEQAIATAGDPIAIIMAEMNERGFECLWTETKLTASGEARNKFDDEAKLDFLRKYALTGRKAYSAAYAGVCTTTIDKYKIGDPTFRMAVEESKRYFRDLLKAEMYRRGVEGFEEGVVGGKDRNQIIMIPKYSDRMLELLAKVHLTELQKESATTIIDNSQTNVVANQFDISTMPPEDLAMFKKLVKNQARRIEEAGEKEVNGAKDE